jgi:MFS family permease
MLGADEEQMGFLGGATNLPFFFFGLLAGVWADRVRKRPLLIWTNLGSALLIGSVPVAAALGQLSMVQIYIVAFGMGAMDVIGTAANQAYIPTLVGRRRLVEANSRLEISSSAAIVLGPGVGGLLVQVLTAPIAVVIDAISFLAAALGLAAVRKVEPVPSSRDHRSSLVAQIREGLAVIWHDRRLRLIMACGATHNFFLNGMLAAMFVLYAVRSLGLNPAELGLVYAAAGPGVLVGALLAGRVPRWFGFGPAIAHSQTLTGVSRLLTASAALLPPLLTVPALVVGEFMLGVARPIFNVNQLSLRQAVTPDHLLGRMNASIRFLMWSATPAGAVAGGLIASRFGLPAAVTVAAIGGLVAAVWVYLPPVWRIRDGSGTRQKTTASGGQR